MQAVRHFSLSCCILCAMAGMVRIFWPEHAFKSVINTVLLLYILASAVRLGQGADWGSLRVELKSWNAEAKASEEYQNYLNDVIQEASVQALERILQQAGIPAKLTFTDGVCRVFLSDTADTAKAAQLLEENCGGLIWHIETAGDAS